jgi:7,8-dihydropterin-6-yl-methyl-4-(beta-D-ribofuranosyl)aminobenzene 5'-phosphate synthase
MADRLVVLMDNCTPSDRLLREHGFSVWVEVDGTKILFDTGMSGAFAQNADYLNIPLDQTESIVLSHGHYDHSGGLSCAFERAPSAVLYAHPDVTKTCFRLKQTGEVYDIGMPEAGKAIIQNKLDRCNWVTQPTQLSENVWVTGPIPRKTSFEDTGGLFYLDRLGEDCDLLQDDLALWITSSQGLIIVLGCCHSGVINTIDYVRELSGTTAIHTIIGGAHLVDASEHRIQKTVALLDSTDIRHCALGHCTGKAAMAALADTLGEHCSPCYVSNEFPLPM